MTAATEKAASEKADKMRRFIDVLTMTSSVSRACESVGVARMTAYRWRDKDAAFAAEWASLTVVDEASDVTPATRGDAIEPQSDELEPVDAAEVDEDDDAPLHDEVPVYPGARYRLTEIAYLGMELHQPDTIVEYDGVPGPHMVPVNDEARVAKGELAGGKLDVARAELNDFVNEAAVRRAALELEISNAQGRLLMARGRQYAGTDDQRDGANTEVAALQQLVVDRSGELRLIAPMIEGAQRAVDAAAATAREESLEEVRLIVQVRLVVREALSLQLDMLAMHMGIVAQKLLALGEETWSQVRLHSNENVAWSCVPDPNAVSKAVVGSLLRSGGLSLDGIAQLSSLGLGALHTFESVSDIVRAQNASLSARVH